MSSLVRDSASHRKAQASRAGWNDHITEHSGLQNTLSLGLLNETETGSISGLWQLPFIQVNLHEYIDIFMGQ